MRTNSGSGESKNNNHDPTLRDRNPQETRSQEANNRPESGPADQRESRK